MGQRARTLGFALGSIGLYALLAGLLPERGSSDPGELIALAPAAEKAGHEDCDHEGPDPGEGHDCGLEAKRMLQRFQEAVQAKGKRHLTTRLGGRRAVRGEVALGLSASVSALRLEALAKARGLSVLRAQGSSALLAGAPADPSQFAALCERLAAAPEVSYAEPNYLAEVALNPSDPLWATPGQRDPLLESAWDLSQGRGGGQGLLIALLDTGVDATHPDLRGRVLTGHDFVNGRAGADDDNGHGTAMAGLIAASGENGVGSLGVAFGARLLPLKVADADGRASVADVAAGIDAALAGGAQVINLSLGTRLPSRTLSEALDRARAAGALVLAAAGNQPEHRAMFPAAYPEVLGVTTTSLDGELGVDAALAETIALGAPGEERLTTLPGGVYGFVHGSSAATAYASGVAALVWSAAPQLSRAQLSQVLRASQRQIDSLAELRGTYRFGRLDPLRALRRARGNPRDLALVDLSLAPTLPRAGQPAEARVRVVNWGLARSQGARVELRLGATVLASAPLDLAPGAERTFALPFRAPQAPGRVDAVIVAGSDPDWASDDRLQRDLALAPRSGPNLRVLSRRVIQESPLAAELVVEVANLGDAVARDLRFEVDRLDATASLTSQGQALARQTSSDLAPGESRTLRFAWTLPQPLPRGTQRLRLGVRCLNELDPSDDRAFLDLVLDAEGALRGLYQASTSVDVVLDAPWRIDPDRTYLPIQLFAASRGSVDPATRLRVEGVTIQINDTPGGGTLVYEDAHQAPPATVTPGLELVDELGQVRATPDAFGDQELVLNGRHDIVRVPRAAFGVPLNNTTGELKFVDTTLRWSQRRMILFGFQFIRGGQHRAVTRTRFAASKLPALPGENHYHDVHHHTIAEWNFGSAIDVFAPRKAYGGPLQMVFETAYAMGVIDQPNQQGAFERLITTDHNCFNSRTINDPDGPDRRPPFGPQSPSAQPGKTQLEAYRAIFGDCAGEEVAFAQQLPGKLSFHPTVDPILRLLPNLPMGAHMLAYRAEHVEGPWHGGNSIMPSPNSPQTTVHLAPLMRDLAQNQRQGGPSPFTFAAHPFSGMGWRREHLDRSLGLDPTLRNRDEVHTTSGEFILKGLEWFNGRGVRRMPASRVDFRDLNPWADADFAQGKQQWDGEIWEGWREWHRFTAETLDYAFTSSPERKFVRKIHHAGGSDAHGDFNFNTARQATPINIQSTYHLGSTAWYDVRTYCFGEGKGGATPGERWLEAFSDGNSVVSDGPLVKFHLDANGRFDSRSLSWHDDFVQAEDPDGRIGGEGPLDGGFTTLVRRGSVDPVFGYRYSSSPEFGDVDTILIYKTEAGKPNPTRSRVAGSHSFEQPIGVGELATTGPDADHHKILDPTEEGPVDAITAFSLGAYTGGNPDLVDLGPDDYRCLTNAVYAIPYDVDATVAPLGTSANAIPAGGLVVEWRFDVSMDPVSYGVEVQALDGRGRSPGGHLAAALTQLVPVSGTGWSDQPGVESSVIRLTNADPIPLDGAPYPSASEVSFVVYWRDAPRDHAGNLLHSIALKVTAPRDPAAQTASTAAGATAASAAPAGGGGGGGGCSLDSKAPKNSGWLWLSGLLALVALIRRR
jgi:subtilase family protein